MRDSGGLDFLIGFIIGGLFITLMGVILGCGS